MKAIYKWPVCVVVILVAAAGCTSDKDLKLDLHDRVKDDVNFAAVQYTIKDHNVTLNGFCTSQKGKDKAEQMVRNMNLVKDIHNNILISPVTLTSVLPIQYLVDSIVASYPMATAIVTDTSVNLTGDIQQQDAGKLLKDLANLSLPRIHDQLHRQ